METAEPGLDDNGVPYLDIVGVGRIRHPVIVSYYALEYGGKESHAFAAFVPTDEDGDRVTPDRHRLHHCADVLAADLKKTPAGDWAWMYRFDSTYNDVTIKKPWCSGFGQAVGIEALLTSYESSGDQRHLHAAERAAGVLFRPLADGGLMFTRGDDVFFEEIPNDARNPTHILNGHMRVLMALNRLHTATGKSVYAKWRDRGLDTLQRWLPLYDTGYWLRYDLNLKKREVAFRLRNAMGPSSENIAIDQITMFDPLSSEAVTIDIGGRRDHAGPVRWAGRGWSVPREIDGRSVRSLITSPQTASGPGNDAYLYLALPGDAKDSLRTDPYLLEIEYFDGGSDAFTLEIRSIAPGKTYRRINEMPMLSWGNHRWRKITIPIFPNQLGWFVGEGYGRAHAAYLEELAIVRPSLKPWARKAWRYYHDNVPTGSSPAPTGPTVRHKVPAVATKPSIERH